MLTKIFGGKKSSRGKTPAPEAPTSPEPKPSPNLRQPVFLWGKVLIEHKGYLSVPNVFLREFHRLGIKPMAALVFLNLMSRKSPKHPCPAPSLKRLATELGISQRSVRDHLKELEDKGFIQRDYRREGNGRNQTTRYDLERVKSKLYQVGEESNLEKGNSPAERRAGHEQEQAL